MIRILYWTSKCNAPPNLILAQDEIFVAEISSEARCHVWRVVFWGIQGSHGAQCAASWWKISRNMKLGGTGDDRWPVLTMTKRNHGGSRVISWKNGGAQVLGDRKAFFVKFTQTVYCWGFHSVLLGVSIAVFPSPFASSFVGLGGVVTYGLLFIPFGLSNFWSCLPVGALASNLTFVFCWSLVIYYWSLSFCLPLLGRGIWFLVFIPLPPQFSPCLGIFGWLGRWDFVLMCLLPWSESLVSLLSRVCLLLLSSWCLCYAWQQRSVLCWRILFGVNPCVIPFILLFW